MKKVLKTVTTVTIIGKDIYPVRRKTRKKGEEVKPPIIIIIIFKQ